MREAGHGGPLQTLKTLCVEDLQPSLGNVGNGQLAHMQHTKLKATNNGGRVSSAVFSSRAKCTIYDFPLAFWMPACASLFLWAPCPCLFWRADFTPESWQQVSCHCRGGASQPALKYLWSFSVVIEGVMTAMAHYPDRNQTKKADVLLSVVVLQRWGSASTASLLNSRCLHEH